MQLRAPRRRWLPALSTLAGVGVALTSRPAAAEDRVDLTTTWYQESRQGGLGGLTVIHPQFAVGTDLGEHVGLDLGYATDVVSGATATVYAVDAVSTATTFSDVRHQGSLGLQFKGRRSALSLAGSIGVERDYISITFGGGGNIDLPGKNTNLAVSYAHNMDSVCDRENGDVTPLARRALSGLDPCAKNVILGEDTMGTTVWRDLSIDTAQATVTQNLAPTLNLQLSGFGSVLRGFQSNPYRRVRIGDIEAQETIPDVRARLAVTVRLNKFLPVLRAATHLDLRGYSNTWGVNAGTVEAAYSQYVGSSLLLRLRARLHQQSAATFFKDAFYYETESTAGAYFTGDRELAPVRNITVGGKLAVLSVAEDDKKVWGVFDKLQINLKGDVFFLGETAADDPDGNVGGRDTQFLSSGQLVDAIAISVGVLADY